MPTQSSSTSMAFAHAALLSLLATSTIAQDTSINEPIAMPNLGRGFSLGALYDARSDQLISGFLWPLHVMKDPRYVKDISAKKSKYSMVYDDKLSDKASLLEVGAELALKSRATATAFGAKSEAKFKLSGSAEFMTKRKQTTSEVKASVAYKLRSFQQTIDVFHPDVKNLMHSKVIADGRATHVVAGVTYGSDCIATFTYKTNSLKQKVLAKAFLKVKMSAMGSAEMPFEIAGAGAETSMETQLKTEFQEKSFSTSSGVTVDILGDVLPKHDETLPTSVDEAIVFLKSLHEHGIGDGGVPMDLSLIPLAWLDTNAAKLKRKLDSAKIDEAMKIVTELDESMESLNELLEIESDGFIAWEKSVNDRIIQLQSFQGNLLQDMSEAIDYFRDGGSTSNLTDVFNTYYASQHTASDIAVAAESKRDEIVNLKSFVSSMKQQASVPTAEHFSDYMAPSLNQKYDNVYILLLTGMNPSQHRASMGLISDFTAYAKALLNTRSPVSWCQTATVRDEEVCLTHYWFQAIHFDSFCEQFCQPQYCTPTPRTCTDPQASAALTFGTDAWCQNPCTLILGFSGNQGPFRADNRLQVLPSPPSIASVTGAGDVQDDPLRQKVTLTIVPPTRGAVTNYRVRVTWLEPSETDGGSGWTSQQQTFDTMEDDTTIVVRKLIAGRKYTFQVAGVSLVGVGPFSNEYRLPDGKMIKIAYPMVTIEPEVAYAVPRKNTGPAWKSFRINVKLSIPAEEPIGQLTFRSSDGMEFDCFDYRDATVENVTCLMKGPRNIHVDTEFEVTAKNAEGDEILGRGNFTYQAMSGEACFETEREMRLFCNATKRCVATCDECREVELDSSGVPVRLNTTEVTRLRTCLSDVCPDSPGSKAVWCPTSSAPAVCFSSSGSTSDCRQNCDLLSSYHAGTDVCAIPCKVNLGGTAGVSQVCSHVMQGSSCTIDCSHGYLRQGNARVFTCPVDNAKELYPSDDPLVTIPTCQASCSIFKCPAGWTKKLNASIIAGATPEACCDETECPDGHYGPGLKTDPCRPCQGATRRRRAATCTDCANGYVPWKGQDDCDTYCNTTSCPEGYKGKVSKEELPGKNYQDCCEEVICEAGLYIAGSNCLRCDGSVRRRRARECTACGMSHTNTGESDDCSPTVRISGYTRQANDCVGGDISGTYGTRSVQDCGQQCSARATNSCYGFGYHYGKKKCVLKSNKCRPSKAAATLEGWNFFKKDNSTGASAAVTG